MTSPQVQQLIDRLGGAIGANTGLGGTIKFDFGEAGSVFIDGKSTPNSVSDGADKSAETTISVALDTFERMARQELDPTSAFMQGQLRALWVDRPNVQGELPEQPLVQTIVGTEEAVAPRHGAEEEAVPAQRQPEQDEYDDEDQEELSER